MKKQYTREEILRIAAEKVRLQKEEEQRAEDEYYRRITTGPRWLIFKIAVVFSTLMFLVTTIDVLVDGETKELDESEWEIDRQLYMSGHQSILVDGDLFVAHFQEWLGHVDSSFAITYSPIFHTGKRLSYDQQINDDLVIRRESIRERSIFTWFPYFQIVMLIPLATYLFKRQKPWFKFAQAASIGVVVPAILLVTIITLL